MATGGGSCQSPDVDRRESLRCSVCLEIFTQPKLLPCHHTFCLKCLEDLTAALSSLTLACPQCRSEVSIPKEGVSAFQSNFYIHPEDLDRARESEKGHQAHPQQQQARDGDKCPAHPKDDLDLYCCDCRLLLCLKCVLTEHKSHTIKNLSDAAGEAKEQLKRDEGSLQKVVEAMTQKVKAEEEERQALRLKKEAVARAARNRHAAVVALADRQRDETLASLNALCDKMESEATATLTTKTGYLQELQQIQQRLQQSLASGTARALVGVAADMTRVKHSEQNKLMLARKSAVTRPVLKSTLPRDSMAHTLQAFLGSVGSVSVTLSPAAVVVEEKFSCKEERDTEVYCLCPQEDGHVWVSYVHCGCQTDLASDKFQETGKYVRSNGQILGKCSWKARRSDRCITSQKPGIDTYCKNKDHYKHHVKLCNGLEGKADVKREKVVSEEPFQTENQVEFTVSVGPHRAFDVDKKEQLLVIVEEPLTPDQRRKVKLYLWNKPKPLSTYCPPTIPFNPADVCFFNLAGKEVLAIADEAGDSIHVVHVQNGSMSFARHLVPGCPLLTEPTALNTDPKGRLWVACRGGRVLTLSPV